MLAASSDKNVLGIQGYTHNELPSFASSNASSDKDEKPNAPSLANQPSSSLKYVAPREEAKISVLAASPENPVNQPPITISTSTEVNFPRDNPRERSRALILYESEEGMPIVYGMSSSSAQPKLSSQYLVQNTVMLSADEEGLLASALKASVGLDNGTRKNDITSLALSSNKDDDEEPHSGVLAELKGCQNNAEQAVKSKVEVKSNTSTSLQQQSKPREAGNYVFYPEIADKEKRQKQLYRRPSIMNEIKDGYDGGWMTSLWFEWEQERICKITATINDAKNLNECKEKILNLRFKHSDHGERSIFATDLIPVLPRLMKKGAMLKDLYGLGVTNRILKDCLNAQPKDYLPALLKVCPKENYEEVGLTRKLLARHIDILLENNFTYAQLIELGAIDENFFAQHTQSMASAQQSKTPTVQAWQPEENGKTNQLPEWKPQPTREQLQAEQIAGGITELQAQANAESSAAKLLARKLYRDKAEQHNARCAPDIEENYPCLTDCCWYPFRALLGCW